MFDNAVAKNGTLNSKLLDELYYETLDLSECVVDYFQANNKDSVQVLGPDLMGFYTLESNRITGGIMQSMSWCLMQKGVRSGEVSIEEASEKSSRLTNNALFDDPIGCDTSTFSEEFMEFSGKARSLYSRIVRLDRILYDTPERNKNPVRGLMEKIEDL